jgi:anaerobic ribonucleoside-triphosphate reductase
MTVVAIFSDKRLKLLLCETLRERRYRFANASTPKNYTSIATNHQWTQTARLPIYDNSRIVKNGVVNGEKFYFPNFRFEILDFRLNNPKSKIDPSYYFVYSLMTEAQA